MRAPKNEMLGTMVPLFMQLSVNLHCKTLYISAIFKLTLKTPENAINMVI